MKRLNIALMTRSGEHSPLETLAKLDNGDIVEYGFCSDDRGSKHGKCRHYLGRGTIYSVDGKVQSLFDDMKHFWGDMKK